MDKALLALGLEGNKAAFYLAALELGEATVQAIASKAGIGRTTAYDVLGRLVEEGLVSQVEKDGKLRVIAEEPGALVRRAEELRRLAEEVLPDLRSLYNRSQSKPRIRYFEGVEGIKTVLWETLKCRSGELRGILAMAELLETPGRAVMDRYIAERHRQGLSLRVIRSRIHDIENIWPSSTQERRALRYAPQGVDLNMTAYLCDDTVSFISSKREHYALVIQSEEFYALQETLFESLWAISSEVPPQE
ncbi:TrmB family transcriptional regulator [Pseudomonas cavernicola]|uniref:TrmB family transcriptional regulator n=1 Tax=Pseudomonas cavernicola TaxID=2320866 RepID=A0A418XPL4_9PSED|nr:helix-turn-helix domain-containing protein [Pseudomonas cavernicola]RJG14400.1 TrmB family transcriptional regulator [Pseudomonas cavernicola]